MSRQWQPSLQKQVPQPSTPDVKRPELDTPSFDEAVYRCTCGIPDASENWICCDSHNCRVEWYHWECVWLTEEPSGDWLCPNCSPKSTKDAELLRQGQGARRPIFPKLEKTAAAELKDTWSFENNSGQAGADKAPVRAKKGVAFKKVTPKKAKSKWIGWVELTSEDEEEHKKSVEAARKAVGVAGGRRSRAPATPSKGRLTKSRTPKGTSAKAKKKTGMEAEEEHVNEVDSVGFLGIGGKREESVQESNRGLSNGRKESSGHPSNATDESDRDLVDIPEGHSQEADPRHPYKSRQSLGPIPRPPKPTPTDTVSASNSPPAIPTEAADPTAPAISSQILDSPPSAPSDPSQDSTLGLTVRHPGEVPSTPPASGAAMVIDTEEQGWTAVITSVAPDGGSSVITGPIERILGARSRSLRFGARFRAFFERFFGWNGMCGRVLVFGGGWFGRGG